jgi:deoxyhypusine synthase
MMADERYRARTRHEKEQGQKSKGKSKSEQVKAKAKAGKMEQAQHNVLRESVTLAGWPEIKGYDLEKGFDASEFIDSLKYTGLQATSLGKAIQLVKNMRRDKAKIFLGFTSNMITSGVREYIKFLVKNNQVHVLVTTAGGVEEDIIKSIRPFVVGDYDASGEQLRDKGVNRSGNIFCPNDRYLYFERFMNRFLERMYEQQLKSGKVINTKEFVYELGRELELQAGMIKQGKDIGIDKIDYESSVTYWAYKNNIPYYCHPITDGSIGDMIYFFKKRKPDFKIDSTDDIVTITDIALNSEKTGIIAIGGSVPKHHIANANLFREGADYAVYINLSPEYEGSNSGASPDEAVSWGKIKGKSNSVKVFSEASIVFPLLVIGGWEDSIIKK